MISIYAYTDAYLFYERKEISLVLIRKKIYVLMIRPEFAKISFRTFRRMDLAKLNQI